MLTFETSSVQGVSAITEKLGVSHPKILTHEGQYEKNIPILILRL